MDQEAYEDWKRKNYLIRIMLLNNMDTLHLGDAIDQKCWKERHMLVIVESKVEKRVVCLLIESCQQFIWQLKKSNNKL